MSTVNTYTVWFVKCTAGHDNVTPGKNYSVVSLGQSDVIMGDNGKFTELPCNGIQTLGMVKLRSVSGIHDPSFKTFIDKAKDDFCAAMHNFYC